MNNLVQRPHSILRKAHGADRHAHIELYIIHEKWNSEMLDTSPTKWSCDIITISTFQIPPGKVDNNEGMSANFTREKKFGVAKYYQQNTKRAPVNQKTLLPGHISLALVFSLVVNH